MPSYAPELGGEGDPLLANGVGVVRVNRCREGNETGLALELRCGQFCFDVDSTSEEELLDLRLGVDHRIDEGHP